MVQSLVKIILVLTLVGEVAGGLYGCNNAMNTDYYRQVVLEVHKQYRQFVFDGDAPHKCGSLPQPKNYYSIDYSCELEDSAATWADNCQYAYSGGDVNKGAGELVHQTYPGSEAPAKAFIRSFYDKAMNKTVENVIPPDVTVSAYIGDWNHLASAGAYQVGCATQNCGTWATTVCHYKVKGPYSGQMYQVGEGCTSNDDCNVILQSTCTSGWCKAPEEVSQDENTMCGGTNPEMNDGARQLLVDWHNHFRSLVIKGNEPAGPDGLRKSPRGGNMYKLTYNCDIEANAQAYANNCPFPTHSTPSMRPGWGENMAQIGTTGNVGNAFIQAIQLFYEELPEYGIIDLENNIFTSADMSSGHYTQVCWAKTYEVGCGIKNCSNGYHIVCQYNPAGNLVGSPTGSIIYPLGNPCTTDSDCTVQATDTCSVDDGLCNRA